jgi:hypothetical protein
LSHFIIFVFLFNFCVLKTMKIIQKKTYKNIARIEIESIIKYHKQKQSLRTFNS